MKHFIIAIALCASVFGQNNQTRIKDLTAATTAQLTNGTFVIDGANGTKAVTYSALNSALAISAGGAPTKLDTNNGVAFGLTNKATGSTTFRGIDDRAAEWSNAKDFGATGDRVTTSVTNIQRAIDYASLTNDGGVFIPAGQYLIPAGAWGDAALVLGYSSYNASSGLSSSTKTLYQESPQYGGITLEGAGSNDRLPNIAAGELYNKGTVLLFTNMTGKIGMKTGHHQNGIVIRNMAFIGDGFTNTSSIGVRVNVGTRKVTFENCYFAQWKLAVDIGGDFTSFADAHADFVTFINCDFDNNDEAVRWNNVNAYAGSMINCRVMARDTIISPQELSGGTGPKITLVNTFLGPTPYNVVELRGTVTAYTTNSFTVTNLTKTAFSWSGDTASTNISAGAATDITTNMISVAESDCEAVNGDRDPDNGLMRRITAINTTTWTITVNGMVYTNSIIGKTIVIQTPMRAFFGSGLRMVGGRIESPLERQFGVGNTVLDLTGTASETTLDGVEINNFQYDTRSSRLIPFIYQENYYPTLHGTSLTIRGGKVNRSFAKIQARGLVVIEGPEFYSHPTYLDQTGVESSGIIHRPGTTYFLKAGTEYVPGSEFIDTRFNLVSSDTYKYLSGLLTRTELITRSSTPTAGTSGERFYVAGSLGKQLRISDSTAGYYNSATITAAATNDATTDPFKFWVTTHTGLEKERRISIAGAGSAAAALSTRIKNLGVEASTSNRWIRTYAPAVTAVTGTAISEVAPTVQSDITAEAATIDGGEGGIAMLTFNRSGTATNYFSQADGSLSVHESSSGRKLMQFNHNASTNSADFMGYVTGGASLWTNAVFSARVAVDDDVYDATGWNASTNVPTKNAVRDQMELKAPLADPVFTGSLQLPNGAAPTTDGFGEIAGDNNAWASGRGAAQFFDGTANTFLIGVLASDTPSNGQVPKWNTGGTITWEDDGGGVGGGGGTTYIAGAAVTNANFVTEQFAVYAVTNVVIKDGATVTNLAMVTPTATTPSAGDNDTSVATTAFISARSGRVALTDAATIATDASLGKTFHVTLGGNRTLGNPTNPPGAGEDQSRVWELIQDGTGSRTITLDTKFAFGTDITGVTLTTTVSKRDFMTAVYNPTADKWYVTGFVRGY
jgi:hypothetical protein